MESTLKRITVFVVLVFVSLLVQARDDIPKGIRYIEASDSLNTQIKNAVMNSFSKGTTKQLLFERVVCGPALWNEIKSGAKSTGLNIAPTTFHIPIEKNGKLVRTQEMSGALFQGKAQIDFLSHILDSTAQKQISVRKPSSAELSVYWKLIPYDIEEPIFVVEIDKSRLLIDFTGGKIMWVDLVSAYSNG